MLEPSACPTQSLKPSYSVPTVGSPESKRSLESLVAGLGENERHGRSIEAVTTTWRFAGIVEPSEVRAWLDVGVFDGHRAGLLRMAGITPEDLAAVPEGRRIGFDFAIGVLSLAEITNIVAVLRAAAGVPSTEGQTTFVRAKKNLRGKREDD